MMHESDLGLSSGNFEQRVRIWAVEMAMKRESHLLAIVTAAEVLARFVLRGIPDHALVHRGFEAFGLDVAGLGFIAPDLTTKGTGGCGSFTGATFEIGTGDAAGSPAGPVDAGNDSPADTKVVQPGSAA